MHLSPSVVILGILVLARAAVAENPKSPYARKPNIGAEPTYRNTSEPCGGHYTEYELKDSGARKYAVAEVRQVTAADSFVSRTLRVIIGNGGSKTFGTITGQDGLTFGIKDFTSGGLLPLLKLIEQRHPSAVKEAFGPETQVLTSGWLPARTSALNDHGLLAIKEIRVGLDRVLSNSRYHNEQLDRFVKEAVEPSVDKFRERNYRREFTLAAMVGAANSGGPGGLERWLSQAEKNTGSKKEDTVFPEFMHIYTVRDVDAGAELKATHDLLGKVFQGKPGRLPKWDDLGHSGRRLRWLAEYFFWSSGADFKDLGAFGPHL